MTSTLQPVTADVDTPSTPADAIDALDVAAQTAGVDFNVRIIREDGPARIYFHSREHFREWHVEGLIQVENVFEIQVEGRDVHVPITFGRPTRWRAVAIYPAQAPCPCNAELVHQAGCPVGDPDTWPECPECSVLNGSHQSWCLFAAAQLPVVVLDVPRPPVCAGAEVHAAVTCRGDVAYRVRYFVGKGKRRTEQELSELMCFAHAQYEEQWTKSVGAIRYAEVAPLEMVILKDAPALPRRTPGAHTDVHYAPTGMRGTVSCGHAGPYSTLATAMAGEVTCPDCVRLAAVADVALGEASE